MSDTPTTADVDRHEPPSVGLRRRVARWILPLLTFAVCCLVAFRIGEFLANRKHAAELAALRTGAAAESNPLAATMPLAGMWSFDELNWSIRSEIVPTSEVESKLSSLDATIVSDASTLPDIDADLAGLIEMLRVRPTERDGNQIYRLDRKSMKLQLVTRQVEGHSKTVACAMAYPHDDQNWQLYNSRPGARRKPAATAKRTFCPCPQPPVAPAAALPTTARRSWS
jgi:hypothetical protein